MTREEAKKAKDKLYNVDFDYDGDALIDKIFDDLEAEKTENPWHTGTPTEEGWYLLKNWYKGCSEYIYDTKFFTVDSEMPDSVVEWQKINEGEN